MHSTKWVFLLLLGVWTATTNGRAQTAPVITAQPVNQEVHVWQRADFSVTATGPSLRYQWRKDGVDIAEGTNATFFPSITYPRPVDTNGSYTLINLPLTQTNHAGLYTVVVTNAGGSVTSAPAMLAVDPVPVPGTVVVFGGNPQTAPLAAQGGTASILTGMSGNAIALKANGSVVPWGFSSIGDFTSVPLAVQNGVRTFALADDHTLALKNNGTVFAWGDNYYGQLNIPPGLSGVSAIGAGYGRCVALQSNGTVVAWGKNNHGESSVPLEAQSGVKAIAAGWYGNLALKTNGTVIQWGWNLTEMPLEAQSDVTAIAVGSGVSVVLKDNGSVVVWGSMVLTNVPESAKSGVIAIAAGDSRVIALKNDGTMVMWGFPEPVTVPAGLGGITAIAVGLGYDAAVVIGDGRLAPAALDIKPSGNVHVLSWPAYLNGYTLESSQDFTQWTTSSIPPVLVGSRFMVTNAAPAAAEFFRLKTP